MTLISGDGDVVRALGLAVVSGAIIGGVFVTVESLLTAAANERSSHESLVTLLTTTIDLNGIDLAGRSLRSIYLPGRALVAAQLEELDVAGGKLYYSDLRYARLARADLRGTDLSGSTLAGADLAGARPQDAIMIDADLTGANLNGADLTGAVLENAVLTRADLRRTELRRGTIRACHLMGTNFESAHLEEALLEGNQYDAETTWPIGFHPPATEDVEQAPVSNLDLATYLAVRARRSPEV